MANVTRFLPGAEPTTFTPGDFFVVCDYNEDLLGRLIRAGERIRFGNTDYARWSHSGLIVGSDGTIVEANAAGVQNKNISEYVNSDYVIISPKTTVAQRKLAVAFAEEQVGATYGVLNFIALGFQVTFGVNLSVHIDGQFICSGLVARATEKYIVGYDRSPEDMMPADLIAYYKVMTNQPLPTFNWIDKALNVVVAVTKFFRGKDGDPPPTR